VGQSTGTWLCFLDADDAMLPGRIVAQLGAMRVLRERTRSHPQGVVHGSSGGSSGGASGGTSGEASGEASGGTSGGESGDGASEGKCDVTNSGGGDADAGDVGGQHACRECGTAFASRNRLYKHIKVTIKYFSL
jgi:hypothetical protein